ncbi:MAG TPA: DUF6755 family protein [Acidimicrobiia bacterium]|nr:DUF6755 family protein [Acidimicrobiia bacterium]
MRRDRTTRLSTAVMVYVVLLLSLQLFLLAVAAEGLLAGEPALAWGATAVSAVLALGTVGFYLYFRRV